MTPAAGLVSSLSLSNCLLISLSLLFPYLHLAADCHRSFWYHTVTRKTRWSKPGEMEESGVGGDLTGGWSTSSQPHADRNQNKHLKPSYKHHKPREVYERGISRMLAVDGGGGDDLGGRVTGSLAFLHTRAPIFSQVAKPPVPAPNAGDLSFPDPTLLSSLSLPSLPECVLSLSASLCNRLFFLCL